MGNGYLSLTGSPNSNADPAQADLVGWPSDRLRQPNMAPYEIEP